VTVTHFHLRRFHRHKIGGFVREVRIVQKVMNGIIVQVGCQTLVFNNVQEFVYLLTRYLDNPEQVEQELIERYGMNGRRQPFPADAPISLQQIAEDERDAARRRAARLRTLANESRAVGRADQPTGGAEANREANRLNRLEPLDHGIPTRGEQAAMAQTYREPDGGTQAAYGSSANPVANAPWPGHTLGN
jgi:hypothetical protein